MDYAQIVEGCRRRNRNAQQALYDEVAPMVMGVCMRYAGDRDEAQDILQDSMVKVFERIDRLKDSAALKTWVYNIAVNTCLDHCRSRRRWERLEAAEDVPAVSTDPYTMEAIVAAMQKLTTVQRAVFNLCDVEGYSLDEAAAALKSSNLAVRVTLCRARKTLKEILIKN